MIEGVQKVRRVMLISLLLSLSLGAAGLVEARELLVMPFQCGVERGRIKLVAAANTHYPIVGKREEVAVTRCGAPLSTGCRTVMAHRFDIVCGGADVSWMRVAAAMTDPDAAPAWIEGGRLNVVFRVRNVHAPRPSCIERPTFALGMSTSKRPVARSRDCRPRARQDDFDHVVLPAGFAPIDEMGARLVRADASARMVDSGTGSLRRVAAAGESRIARADPDTIIREPLPALEPYEARFDQAASGDEWVTVVRAATDLGRGRRDHRDATPGSWAWLLAVMALATVAGLFRARLSYPWPEPLAAFAWRLLGWWRLHQAGVQEATNAGAAVTALMEQTESVVSELKGAGPLREVLQAELRLVRQRLSSIEDAAADDEESGVSSAPQYRALVRELERIRRIADSAAASLSGARQAASLPRTTSEAYDVLGVNPDVSEGVLKKIVGALRMSWHPDHARDDEDRQVREDRIRQINIAWDLINAKRQAA